MEETEVNGGEQNVDGLRLSLSVSASDVISPLTKASATDANAISDLNILVYNKDNNRLVKGLYLTGAALNGLTVNNNEENKAVNYDIALQNGSYRVRVIANAESDLSAEPFDKIDNLSYGTLDNLPKMVMSASADDVSVSGGKRFCHPFVKAYLRYDIRICEYFWIERSYDQAPKSIFASSTGYW